MDKKFFLLSFLMIIKIFAEDNNISKNEEIDSVNISANKESDSVKEMIQIIKKIFEPWKDEFLGKRDGLFEYFKKNNYFQKGEKGLFNYACIMTVSTLFRLKKKTLAMGALGFFGYEVYQNLSEDNKKKFENIGKDIKISLNSLSSSK
jgi:hypothetical protein